MPTVSTLVVFVSDTVTSFPSLVRFTLQQKPLSSGKCSVDMIKLQLLILITA